MPAQVTMYSRVGCHLCDAMRAELGVLAAELGFRVEEVDIDADPVLAARFNAKVPVLALAGEPLCCHFLDESVLKDALAHE